MGVNEVQCEIISFDIPCWVKASRMFNERVLRYPSKLIVEYSRLWAKRNKRHTGKLIISDSVCLFSCLFQDYANLI